MAELGDILEKIGEIKGIIRGYDQRFSSIEERLEKIDKKCDDLQEDVSKLRSSFTGLKVKVASISTAVGMVASLIIVFTKDAIGTFFGK